MQTCEVLIVGGGPAGSACAWKLRRAGLDVLVVDKSEFPRHKVCAGWITPQVIDDLEIDVDDYRRTRTFQPITSFRVGIVGREETVEATYSRPVSYGIRRCEFDDYLLKRSCARLLLGGRVSQLRRDGDRWIVNDEISAAVLVGAGGHFCPVAKHVGGSIDKSSVVAAREVEFQIEDASSLAVAGERPELYFCDDFKGYGWCFRKGQYLNVGFGRLDAHELPAATNAFVDFLKRAGRIGHSDGWTWQGHAYLLSGPARRTVRDGVLLIGDAAGLAYPESGEGIRPAIESGLMAASTILAAAGRYTASRLESYDQILRARFGQSGNGVSLVLPPAATTTLGRVLLGNSWFVRRVVLDRWFLHAHQRPLAA